jgi:hypothetical protein
MINPRGSRHSPRRRSQYRHVQSQSDRPVAADPNYFAAVVIDPDGYRIEAYCLKG